MLIKKIVASLPERIQYELKRLHFFSQIKKGKFISEEPEYAMLEKWIKPGDWVIDVGANIGHYTKKMSDLTGTNGRVFALEPVPVTFSLLSANSLRFQHANTTLINAAASDMVKTVSMTMPFFNSGLKNYYRAQINEEVEINGSSYTVLTLCIDSLKILKKVSFIKIDAEGHEMYVVKGLSQILEKDHPVLVIETDSNDVIDFLEKEYKYHSQRLPSSPNIIFE